MSRVAVLPITTADLSRVGVFLQRNLNNRISAETWAQVADVPWTIDVPNHGFMLRDQDSIVGVYLALYSERSIDGQTARFCNLAAWCVAPRYRLYGLQLLTALLAQPGYHFTDLSPSGNTVPVNERLKFQHLDTATVLMLNLPWITWPGRCRVSSERNAIESELTGPELRIFRDHRNAKAANHVLITRDSEHCYVIFRRDRRKRLPLFASVLYVSNSALFGRTTRLFGRHLLVRHRIPLTLMELRVTGSRPPGSILLGSSRPKMFRSDTLQPKQIDNLYSELVCVSW